MFNRAATGSKWLLLVVGLAGLAVLGASLFPTAQAQDKKITVYLTKPAPDEGDGAVLRLDALPQGSQPAQITEIVKNLTGPANDIVCGPDGRLYVKDFVREGDRFASRIVRFNQDGTGETLMAKVPTLAISSMVFSTNGKDLYFGSHNGGGIWRLKGADPENQPEQILRNSAFQQPDGRIRSIRPYALLNAGPFKGDMLIIDGLTSTGSQGNRVLRAKAPDFTALETFIPSVSNFVPSGVAVNSKGEVFVTHFDGQNGRVLKYAPDGTPQGGFAALNFANQIWIDSTDTAWVTNAVFQGNSVRGGLNRFAPDGNRTLILDRTVIVRGVTACEE